VPVPDCVTPDGHRRRAGGVLGSEGQLPPLRDGGGAVRAWLSYRSVMVAAPRRRPSGFPRSSGDEVRIAEQVAGPFQSAREQPECLGDPERLVKRESPQLE